jgi:DtxR family Mn-dependent transcriptional regulator
MGNIVVTQPSVSVGDYLKAVWEIAGSGAASTKGVADRLSVSSASVTNMFARLQVMGFALYEPYRGASLTRRGRTEALRLVRLIETFLLEHLGYSWEDVHEEAERLEHAVSDEFTERLAEILGHPERDPHGAPIPASDGALPPENSRPLSGAEAGGRFIVSRVENRDPAVLTYLRGLGLVPGRALRVREVRALDGVVTAEDEDGVSHALGAPLARSILVRHRA